MSTPTLDEVIAELKSLGNEKTRELGARNGAGENQFGVKMGDIRNVAKRLKTNPELAAALWRTGNLDAMHLAVLLMRPKDITADELEQMVRTIPVPSGPTPFFCQLADWLNSYVVKLHADKETLRQK